MTVRFIVDSASDMIELAAPDCGDVFIPLTVTFADEEGPVDYLDGVTINHDDFFKRLIESDSLPQTSQATPYVFEQAYKNIVEAGDTAVVVTVSSKLSGTYESALAAAGAYPESIFVVDSLNATIGQRILVELGMRLREEGKAAAEIAAELNEAKTHICTLALLDTLEYLQRGGRIPKTVSVVGGMLNIKPVIVVNEGAIELLGKARGSKKGNNLLIECITKAGGVDFSMPSALAYAGLSDAYLMKYLEDSRPLWEGKADVLPIYTVGAAIGTHVGPGAIAVSFFSNK